LRLEKCKAMKEGIHPKEYRLVVFKDVSNESSFITKSCVNTKDTIVWEDGNEYPLFKVEISSTSHPYFTGKMKLIDTAGRVDKFTTRYKKHIDKKAK
jgi:large subunit ribosomal protein L31